MKLTRRLGDPNIGIGIHFTSSLAFTFIGLLILGCALLINMGLGMQRAMLEASGISYEQRLLVESMGNKVLFLFSNLKAQDMSDGTIDRIRQDIVRMNASAQLNQKRLQVLMASHLASRWLMEGRTRNQVRQYLDEVDILLDRLDRRVRDISQATIPALRAGYNYWQPVDVLTADKGRLTAGIGGLNIAIYQASLHQNRLVFLLYGALLILVLAGVWLIWFLTLRPLGVRLERNYREIREKNASLAFQANHDTLTGLLNRAAFMQHMNELGRAGRLYGQTALILADVDNFKSINDNHGHHAGDRVLVEFARRLGLEQGRGENLYRLSGDEFAVVITPVTQRAQVVHRAEQILRSLRRKITLSGYDLPISGSLGGAWGQSCGSSLEEMFSAADMALHHVKNNGRNHFALFDEVSSLTISHILEMEQELYQAVEQRAFVLYYQPIVDIHDNSLIRLEALLRWRHPQRGILEPD
ncbi:MAG: diguanylate cyclase, partial [Thiothrix sp.]|nr:diguanylate cyclase [Thiothrix sp.]